MMNSNEQDDSTCFTVNFFDANGFDPEAFSTYLDKMATLIFVDGVLNSLLFLVYLGYITIALIKKTKLSTFTWLGLSILLGLNALLTYGEFAYDKIGDDECNF